MVGDPSDRDETVEYDKWDDDASSELKRKIFKGLLSELNMLRLCLDDRGKTLVHKHEVKTGPLQRSCMPCNTEKELEKSHSSLELVLSQVEPKELDPLKCMTRGNFLKYIN